MRSFLLTFLFGVAFSKIYFHEKFENLDGWKEADGKEGNFGLATEQWGIDTESLRLKTLKDAKFYAIAKRMPETFDNTDKQLALLITVKHEQKIDCGGGYIKLMNSLESLEKFDGDSQYEIMFGPDFCGNTKKVHAILRHEEENLLINKDVRTDNDEYTHQYVFILNPDNTFEIKVDGKSKKKGDVKEFWDFQLPKTINDPDESKPDDWIDNRMMDDPEAKKPEDWVEEETIVDPDAVKPEDWDDEDDGEWEAPMIDNPEYKGPWHAERIENPDYKGAWEHPQIPNPEYKEVSNPAHRLPINYLGIDIWQVKSGTLFGDIVLADSEADIDELVWDDEKRDAEKEAKKEFDNIGKEEEEEDDTFAEEDMEELSVETSEEVESIAEKKGDKKSGEECDGEDEKCTMEDASEKSDKGAAHEEL